MPDLITEVLAPFESLAREYSETVGTLARHGADGHAKAVDGARLRLLRTIADVRDDFDSLTVDQYASLHHVHPRTVARWIDAGELAAEQTAKGWRIRRTAIRHKPRV